LIRIVTHPTPAIPSIARRNTAWRQELDPAIVDAPGSAPLLERLHAPGALVVTTGQQPGLLTGPIYGVHKALAAAALARRLERMWQVPVVPIFWVAGDDHDFAEASVACWPDAAGALVRWSLPERSADAVQRPMSQEIIPAEIVNGLALLDGTLPAGASRDMTMALLQRHYRPGATLHAAYADTMAELLAPYGVLCLDATHPAVKRAQVPLLAAALTRAAELDKVIAAIEAPETGIIAGDGASLVFIETPAGRERLVADAGGFRTRRSAETVTLPALLAQLEAQPERFSANVLLRPVVESAILPTVAYAAGPAEFRYQTRQASVLYPLLGVDPQQPVRRWSGTTVEPWAERLLSRLDLTAEAVITDDGTLAHQVLQRDLPPAARDAIAALRNTIARSSEMLREVGTAIDPVLTRAVNGRRDQLVRTTDGLQRLLDRHLKRRDDIAYAQFARLVAAFVPGGKPQERVYTAAAYLGRHGESWLGAIVAATEQWAAA
jgi:bacillithiol biosynthesis cysteine-adding enzyme BshC